MPGPRVISVPITGLVPRERDDSALPVTTGEQIESTDTALAA
jgi:hypothetical protein